MSSTENSPGYVAGSLPPARGFANATARNIRFSHSSRGQQADCVAIKTEAERLKSSLNKNMDDFKSSIPSAVESLKAATVALDSFAKPSAETTEFQQIAAVLPALSRLQSQLQSREITLTDQAPSAIDNLFVNTKNLVERIEWFRDTYNVKKESSISL